MLNKMRNMLSNHIPALLAGGMLTLLLVVNPNLVSATSLTQDVAVPMTSSSKIDPIRKNIRVQVPTVSSESTPSGSSYSGYSPLKTTSSATMKSWNAGAIQNAAATGNQTLSASQTDITPSALPIAQIGTPRTKGSASTLETQHSIVKRRAQHNHGDRDGQGNYWDEDEDGWVPITDATAEIGDVKYEDGVWYRWDGTGWVPISIVEPPTPIGDIPFFLLALLLVFYVGVKRLRLAGRH